MGILSKAINFIKSLFRKKVTVNLYTESTDDVLKCEYREYLQDLKIILVVIENLINSSKDLSVEQMKVKIDEVLEYNYSTMSPNQQLVIKVLIRDTGSIVTVLRKYPELKSPGIMTLEQQNREFERFSSLYKPSLVESDSVSIDGSGRIIEMGSIKQAEDLGIPDSEFKP